MIKHDDTKKNPHGLVLPVNFGDTDMPLFLPHFKYVLKQPRKIQFKKAFFFNNFVITDSLFKLQKEHLPWEEWGIRFKKTFWIISFIKALSSRNFFYFGKKDTEYAIVVNPFSNNYFHWITEVIPKLIYLKTNGTDFILILPSCFTSEYQIRTLQLLGINYQIISHRVLFFKKLSIVSNFSEYPGYYHRQSILDIRHLFNKIAEAGCVPHVERVYLSRKKTDRRKVSNEEALIPVLKKMGFDIVYPEDLSFLESLTMYRNVKILVSAHGAALTNMIFMQEQTSVLELQLKGTITDKCYFILANTCKLNYYYQLCESDADCTDHIKTDIKVDADEFEKNLKLIVERYKNDICSYSC